MADARDVNKASNTTVKSVDMASRAFSATAEAVLRFLESRSFANREAKILADTVRKGGQLGCMTMDPVYLKDFKHMLQDEGIASVGIKFEQENGETRNGLIFRKEDQQRVEELREKFLASRHLLFNISKDNLTALAKDRELHEYSGLTYAEMCNMKERLGQNQVMFAAKKNDMNDYSIYVRKEDKDMADLMRSGVKQEKEGTGKKIYEQMDHEREKRQNAINQIMADKDTSFLVGNYKNSKTLYVDKEGLWYEQEGTFAKRKFVSRNSEEFEKELCDCMDRIRDPQITRKEFNVLEARLFKQNFTDPDKNDVLEMEKAMKLYGFRNRKDLEKATELKSPDEKMKDLGRQSEKDRKEFEAAYSRVRAAIDLAHTEKDKGHIFVSEAEREAFNAEQEIRKQYEYCVIRGYEGKGSMAEQYKEESMDKDKMEKAVEHIQEEKHFTVDDMRRNVVWREKYEMPDYVDKDKDGVFDEFDQDVHQKEKDAKGMPDPEEESPSGRD